MTPTVTSTGRALAERRERILHRVLVATAVLAGIAYVPGMWAAYGEELWGLMVADTLAYGVILVFAFVRRIPYAVRAGGFVAVVYILALVLMVQLGPMGAGTVWLAAGPVLAAVFFRTRGALTALSLTTLILVALGIMIHLDPGLVGGRLPEVEYTLVAWLANAGSILFLTAVLSLSVAALVRWLEGTLSQSTQAAEELRGANLALEREAAERQRLQDRLLQSQKMEALGTLAGGIAHDFNNMLAAILGNLDLSLLDANLEGKTRKRLEDAFKASERARDLTRQLLTFAKGGEPIRQTANLAEVIKDSTEFILHGSEVKCRFCFADDLSPVDIDTIQISQVVQNLILNAIQSMPEGGIVDVSCVNVAAGEMSNKPLEADKDYVQLIISDQGKGIAADIIDKVFDPYFSTKSQGSGLGLSIVHSIISKHEGHIEVDSVPEKGTRFIIYLPAAADHAQVEQEQLQQLNTKALKGKVLVMDDEEPVRQTICLMLEEFGLESITAADGQEAVRIYQQSLDTETPIRLLIMDLTVPGGMGGKEAAQEILALDPGARIIVSSGYSQDPIMAKYKDYGFFAVLAKPFSLDELQKVLHQGLMDK